MKPPFTLLIFLFTFPLLHSENLSVKQVSNHVWVWNMGINSTIVKKNNRYLMINCPPLIAEEIVKREKQLPHQVVCLNYRSSYNGGLTAFDLPIAAPEEHSIYFESPIEVMINEKNIYHRYSFHPDHDMLNTPREVTTQLNEGSSILFEGIRISFLRMCGDTNGELSCVIEDNKRVGVCTDLICGDGKIPFLHRTSRAYSRNGMEYHGFLLRKDSIVGSLRRMSQCDLLIPAREEVIYNINSAIDTLDARLNALYQNYAEVSSVNFYFKGRLTPQRVMPQAKYIDRPAYNHQFAVSNLIISRSGKALLVDCGSKNAIDKLDSLQKAGLFTRLDFCFVTHHHDDHTEFLNELRNKFNCRILTTSPIAAVLENPSGLRIPCLSQKTIATERVGHKESFQWEEFNLTFYHFPGQTLYHAAMLADNGHERILFAGDSFSPLGIDDYCVENRNFINGERGYMACLNLVEEINPTMIINPHQEEPFAYATKEINYIRSILINRIELIKALSPWESSDISLDPIWARIYPFHLSAKRGEPVSFRFELTGHKPSPTKVEVHFTATEGITPPKKLRIRTKGYTSGLSIDLSADTPHPDPSINFAVTIPKEFKGDAFAIAAHLYVDGQYMGEAAKSICEIRGE